MEEISLTLKKVKSAKRCFILQKKRNKVDHMDYGACSGILDLICSF